MTLTEQLGVLPQPSEAYFKKVNLEITTRCNLRCPECSAGIGINRVLQDHPWEYFVEAAKWIYGVDSLVCIGGEATMHSKFAEFIPKFRELFGCREMVLWTNGFLVERYADIIRDNFDAVYASLYDQRTAPWNKRPNGQLVQFVKSSFEHLTMEEPHIPRSRRGSGGLCERGIHGPVTYADGKLYGCCVAMGLDEGIGVVPSANWREEILQTPLPCHSCCFSPAEAA